MPIHGLSDERRLPRAGKIHLGIKKESQRTKQLYPDATDFFVVKADESTPAESAAAFLKVYGKAPKRLKIILPLNNPDAVFPQWFKQYTKTSLVCRGDGNKAVRWFTQADKSMIKKEISCVEDPSTCPYVKMPHGKPDCGPVANLQFLLPEVPVMGVWQIDTSSRNGIIEINSTLEMLQFETERSFGRKIISGIPIHLTLLPREANPDGRKKTIFILHMDYQEGLNNLKELLAKGALPAKAAEVAVEPIPEDEVPADLRPQIQGPTGPHTPSVEDYQGSVSIPKKSIENTTLGSVSDALEDPPDDLPDPVEQAVIREFFRLGIPKAKEEALRRSIPDQAKLLAVLQKTQITKERLAQLRAIPGKVVDDNGYFQ